MNVHDRDIATPKVTTGPIAGSHKVYAVPEAAPDLCVPLREIALTEAAAEPPVPVYDTSGPYTDNNVVIDVEAGLTRTRVEWVRERGGVEEYEGRPIQPVDNGNVSGKHLARAFPTAHRPLHAAPAPSLPSPASAGQSHMREQDGNLSAFGLRLYRQRFSFVHPNAIALPASGGG